MKTLAELQLLCQERGISVDAARRGKEPYIEALRNHFWQQEFGDQRLPSQITPMLLSDWSEQVDLAELQRDDSNWIVQPKLDGVRVLMHISKDGIRVTGRNTSEATFRLTEHQGNLSHLFAGVTDFEGTILDGELICPTDVIDTEETRTTSALQAAIAILAAAPDKAKRVQDAEQCHLQFHCFDILSCLGEDVALWSLRDRIDLLGKVLADINNPHVFRVPTIYTEKQKFHDETLLNGGEGTVWKLLDETYEPGRRVTHWLKRKRCLEFAAFVSGYKLGNANAGNRDLIGALEFSTQQEDGSSKPIAWVSSWTDTERRTMTLASDDGTPSLNPSYFQRSAIVSGLDIAGRSQRLRHARLVRWI